MINIDITKKSWYEYLEPDVRELLNESIHLGKSVAYWKDKFHDYSFVVFPAGKAYEGFLKKLFLDMGFISQDQFYYKYFRIGKALNPELEKKYRQEDSIYDKLEKYCGGPSLADKLWQTWKKCRNSIFHWFPNERTAIDLEEANNCVIQVIDTIDECVKSCKIVSK